MVSNIKMGIKVESEHKGTYNLIKKTLAKTGKLPTRKQVYKSIAKEHLAEDNKYYKKIKKMGL